jgi:AraC family transcriptional regulator of adaptative response/methylated-DNA-[protein]-cysteine methyltransferase
MNMVNGHSRRATDYERIERAILYLEENYQHQPRLKELAQSTGLSEFHFQRLFRRWAGISPKRFVQYLTAGHAVRMLRESRTNLDAAYDSGLSGGGRLHDLLVNFHAVTPGELKRAGAGLTIHYGFHPSPFGECLIGVTSRGVCHLGFVPPGGRRAAFTELTAEWPRARFEEAPRVIAPMRGCSRGLALAASTCMCPGRISRSRYGRRSRIPPGNVVLMKILPSASARRVRCGRLPTPWRTTRWPG